MEQLGYHWKEFHEIWYLNTFRKSVEKIKVGLKFDLNKKRVLYMKTNVHFWLYLAYFFLEWEMFQTKVVMKIKTRILLNNFFFRKSFPIWNNVENVVERDRPQMTIRRMRIGCWIPKSTNTHVQYVLLIAFPLQQRLHVRASVFHYTYNAGLVFV
jgi:hypothetical protein